MDDFEDEVIKDEIEVTELPAEEAPHTSPALVALGAQLTPRSRAWRIATTAGAIFFVLLVVLNAFPSARNAAFDMLVGPTPTPTLGPILRSLATLTAQSRAATRRAALAAFDATLDPAPQNCPSIAALQNFSPATFSPGIGSSPVWVTGFSGSRAQLIQPASTRKQYYGWGYHLLLIVKTANVLPVLLFGNRLDDGTPLLFENGISIRGHDPVTTFFSLATDYHRLPSHFDSQWKAWTVIMYIPAAGCYTLKASWPGGSWQANFAAGS